MTRNIAAPLPFRFTSEMLPDTSYLLTPDYEYFIFLFFFFLHAADAFQHPTYPRRRIPSGQYSAESGLAAVLQIESSLTESIFCEKRFSNVQ